MNAHEPQQDDLEKALRRHLSGRIDPAGEERLREVFRKGHDRFAAMPSGPSRSRVFAVRQWIASHAAIATLLTIGVVAAGAAGVRQWLTVEEAQKKFNINDRALQVALKAYQTDHGGMPPVFFYQLTTPVAYMNGPWNPEWGHERIASEQEIKEYDARPKWERPPYQNQYSNWQLWTPLTPVERDEWIRWRVNRDTRPHFVVERFSPAQKAQMNEIVDRFYEELRDSTLKLVAEEAPKEAFDKESSRIFLDYKSKPLEKLFKAMRLEQPMHVIQRAVREYREKYHKNPATMADLRETLLTGPTSGERLTPGFFARWGADRPLLPIELDTPTKWDKPPWDTFDVSWADWHKITEYVDKYGEKEVYDGYVRAWVDNDFDRYLPYYPFTPEQRKHIEEIRDQTFAEMKTTLRALVARKSSRWAFEDETTAVWDKAVVRFHEVFEEMKKAQGEENPVVGLGQ